MAGHFELLRVLGTGNFGQAWLAQPKTADKPSDQKFVVKQVRLLSLSQKELDQALTEVAVLARCRHTNVIRYREAFVDNGALHIVMEYADGGDLRQKMLQQQGIHFKGELILDWFIQLCFAVRYIHSQHILHRDLKTQNIFLTRQNIIKLGDFGIARVLLDKDDHAQTTIGTPYYLSPEICEKKMYNHKSDMWALGCVLYEMCTLHVPFDAPNFTVLVTKILQGQYQPIPSHFGPVLEDLVQILLNVYPEKRPSSEQVLCIPVIQPVVQTYLKRQKSLLRPSQSSMSGESPPVGRHKIPRFQIVSPQTPNTPIASGGKRKESPMNESPTISTVQLKESPGAGISRSKLAKPSTPILKKPPTYNHLLIGSPSTSVSGFSKKKSKTGDNVKNLKQARITPPGSAEIRRAKLKKLDGATPKISNLLLRQRAIQSANCMKTADAVKSPAPKLSLFKHLFQKRAYSDHLLNQETSVSPSPMTTVPSHMTSSSNQVTTSTLMTSASSHMTTSSNQVTSVSNQVTTVSSQLATSLNLTSEDEDTVHMSMIRENQQESISCMVLVQKSKENLADQQTNQTGDSENDLDLRDRIGDADVPSAPADDQVMECPKDPNNNLDKVMSHMTVSSSPKKQMKKMNTYTLLIGEQMQAGVIRENGCQLEEGIPEEYDVMVPEVLKEVASTLYQSACQMTGSHFTALETLRCYLETAWGTERFCEVYPKFRDAVQNKVPFSEVSVEMSQSEWCLFPVLQQVYILETFNGEKIAT